MNSYQKLQEKLTNRAPVMMANMMVSTSPLLLSAFSAADCILLDKEHGVYGTEELIPLTMQCRALGLPSIVRVEDAQYHLIAKAIDLGADGIMIPRTETVEQVKTAVEAMHFFPKGRTGFGGFGLLREGENLTAFNQGRLLFLQIESEKGLNAMEDMIAAYGEYISAFIIGPNDYSIMMGVPLDHAHPVMLEQYRRFYQICKAHQISCGVFDPDRAHIDRDVSLGANVFWLSDDLSYMRAGFEQCVAQVKDSLNAQTE